MLLLRTVLRQSPAKFISHLRPLSRGLSHSQLRENKNTAVAKSTAGDGSEVSADVRPIGERIKENTKTASYMGVIVLGATVTGIMFFAIFRELMSSSSPNNVYSSALEECINEPRVQDALGQPIKGYGEESRRGRRQHVAHTQFEREGVPYIRMQFYIQGIRNKATVHLEKRLVRFPVRFKRFSFTGLLFSVGQQLVQIHLRPT